MVPRYYYYESQLPYMFNYITQDISDVETVLHQQRQQRLWYIVIEMIELVKNDTILQLLHPAIQQYFVELLVWKFICEAPLFFLFLFLKRKLKYLYLLPLIFMMY